MLSIYNLHYQMELSCGGDLWRLHGDCPEHPNNVEGQIMPSTPVSLNENDLILTTVSGRIYKIESFHGNPAEVIAQIKKDIENKGYEIH